ncbi:MAG: glycosyltransferase WbuB [Acidobacteria bacterium]|nr:MAG: glycosyltransferase WbuB [Acidobacteriota bacterium]
MRILYFVQYFNLPDEPGGSRPYQFARQWARAGHEVTVVTGALNHKTLTVPERFRGRLIARETIDGVRVLRVWSYAGIRGSFGRRLLNFLSYAVTATLAGLIRAGSADIVYASSTPLTVGLPGALTAAVRRAPFVFEVRDLWPQSAVVAGVLRKRGPLTLAARWFAWRLYRRAARVVAVTRGIESGLIDEGVPPEKVLFVPNGVDDWMLEAGERPVPERPDRFRVVYCGAHGRWNGLDQILEAAELLREDPVEFVFIGDGDERARLEERARRAGLDHVRFVGAVPKREAFEQLRAASANVVVTWRHPFQRMVLANKIFDYLAAGRPVIVAAEGEMAELVRRAGCGLVTPPEDPPALARAVRELAAMREEELARLGSSGRRYAIENFHRGELAWRLLEVFGKLAGRDPREPSSAPGPRLVADREAGDA